MGKEQAITALKVIVVIFMLFFGVAAVFQILSVLDLFTGSYYFSKVFSAIFSALGEPILGFGAITFFSAFVLSIFISNKLGLNLKSNKENSKPIFKVLKIGIFLLAGIGLFYFLKTDGIVEGTPVMEGSKYAVYYKGNFVKDITKEQYYNYKDMLATSTRLIFTSVFLFFSGMPAVTYLEALLNINKNEDEQNIQD